jgi:hypothetical protein
MNLTPAEQSVVESIERALVYSVGRWRFPSTVFADEAARATIRGLVDRGVRRVGEIEFQKRGEAIMFRRREPQAGG